MQDLKRIRTMNESAPLPERMPRDIEAELRFETLLADISTRFVSLGGALVDDAISDAQGRICEALGFDRSTLWQVSDEDPWQLLLSHLYEKAGAPKVPVDVDARKLYPWTTGKVMRGEIVAVLEISELPAEAALDVENLKSIGTRSTVVVPLPAREGKIAGALTFASVSRELVSPTPIVRRLRLLAEVFANALARRSAEVELERMVEEVRRLRDEYLQQNIYLREQLNYEACRGGIVGESEPVLKMLSAAERVAPTDAGVLITGETGTGKELLAQVIHEMSRCAAKPMVRVNCAALPATLIENELFGREKGAYTGALTQQVGRFELANGSTLFLDEIAELPLELQSKLLRVLQEGKFERLGSNRTQTVNVRLIAATNHDLEALVQEGLFRADLYYRLNVFPIVAPPLRERAGDIPLLIWHFLNYFSQKMGKSVDTIPRKTIEALERYPWPGNVRELRNLIERSVILSDTRILNLSLPATGDLEASDGATLGEIERRYIQQVLERSGWRIRGAKGAAQRLGLNPTTLHSRLRKLGITRPKG